MPPGFIRAIWAPRGAMLVIRLPRTAVTPFPIPVHPSFAGLTLFGQWLVFDSNGALFGLGSLSNGLSFTIGN